MESAIYIHIPFCEKKCYYCDFLSFANKKDEIEKYIEKLIYEIKLYPENIYETIYFGGGTPSLIEPRLIKKILENLNIKKNAEITFEVNPKTVDEKKLEELRKIGINRLSIGCQSFDNEILKKIGRIHDREEAINTYKMARKVGFNNINLDLIFATPGQTIKKLDKDLEIILKLNPEHIAIYSLIWEKGTKLWEMKKIGKVKETNQEIEAEMYEKIIKKIKENGYSHYEISNFAKKGYESKHNMRYWRNEKYLGIGLGASGYIDNIRYKNVSDFKDYYEMIENKKKPILEKEIINQKSLLEYKCILGLRLLEEGVSIETKENVEKAEKLIVDGYLKTKKDSNYILTNKGMMLANNVFMEFLE
ncbi:MAG: coproporphyrinogen III oxidase [Fusobacteriia bacterium 4572_132]|nr:MAG: coproporphyrinogen III oxidase [Fusobacteriia bacterium 4572_132]